jgi:diguanylate cyclase (GGDEF)-like protein
MLIGSPDRRRLPRRCLAALAAWPVWSLPRGLRRYVVGVIVAAGAAAGVAVASTGWRAGDGWLFALLVCFGAAAVELTRRTTETAGLIKDVHGIWYLPIALLLPPVYCLAAPAATFALLQLRTRRTIAHRRVFSAAANGLSLGATSVVFHALRSGLPSLSPAPGARALLWLLAAAGCALLWTVIDKTLVMTAVRTADRTVSVREKLLAREPLLNDLCEISAGLMLAGAATVSWALILPALPLVIVLQRSFRHAQLLSQARVDAKTGLLNAAAWRTEAVVQLAHAQRTGTPLAVAIADLDHFKAVNDTYGHLTGDAALAAAAEILRRQLRPYDLIGRFGGEEFSVLLPHTGAAEAVHVAERLRRSLASEPLPGAPGHDPLHVTVSIGVAATEHPGDRDLTDLLAAADAALYQAKNDGRNTIRLSGDASAQLSDPQARPAAP